ncbi:hypothetical protein P152DRAFT_397454 [Eremomyces bilateralis CBS 781.70]|uniref:Uncharacterized protein n=1 Tax=Eremomyces bilateralis CBS 781.70 TaxID=1392243 RepID=A0A6G1G2G5_9PEZI|nr:uncharacterized protein P152DRAFT_397454 [Eremomyces bilateralis CBS 781.70]KAF1812208.1 hypothetical protein P152DRAFT_397454 [Eremomyces bilateralis CBS 781.70]
MLFPQIRGSAPLRVGSASIYPHHILGVAVLLVFLLALNFVHAPPSFSDLRSTVVSAEEPPDAGGTLPRYWSVTGKNFEGAAEGYRKPRGLKIVGLVFYGRPASVSILDCYLKRNLAENGGFLDEVIFLARTNNKEDLAWLDGLLATTKAYRKQPVVPLGRDYSNAYDLCEDDVMYIKIDDDVVFIEDSAIPSIVQTRLEHPEYYVVSANIINQPSLSWVHLHLGTIRPYMPELHSPPGVNLSALDPTWRASDLPHWTGPDNFTLTDTFAPPFAGHRWLPCSEGTTIDGMPASSTTYDAFSPTLFHWTIAAQLHYSFFEHLENNELWRYKFQMWDYKYRRMGIQFIAIMGRDINAGKPLHWDDEFYFSEEMPKRLKRHAIVDGRAVVSHFSFGPQRDGIAMSDALDRYRAYANENICPQ